MEGFVIKRNPSKKELEELDIKSWDIWSKEVSRFSWHYDEQEVCYFLEGEVIITPAGEPPVHIGSGDLVTFPEGMHCVWDIRKAVRKHYRFG